MEVGRAAAEVGLEPIEVRLGAIGNPRLVMKAALHLVGLLVILMRPHVVSERAGKRVEYQLFEAIAERGIAGDGQRLLQRKHRLDHGAEFRTLRWVAPGEMF